MRKPIIEWRTVGVERIHSSSSAASEMIRIWSQNFNSAHAFRWKFDFKILRGQISKILTPLNQK